MSTTILGSATEIAKAVSIAAKRPVVLCPQPADAASPVTLILGPHTRSLGQAADYRHHVEVAANANNAVLVSGSHHAEHGWVATVDVDDATAEKIYAVLRGWGWSVRTLAGIARAEARRHEDMLADLARAEAERPEREAYRARWTAEVAARVEQYRPLFDAAMSRVRVKANGQKDGGEVARVRIAYRKATGEGATGSYPEDLAHGLAVLTRLSGQELAAA